MAGAYIHVAVAAVVNDRGEVLVSQRKQGSHLGGYWEFPGGKLEPGECVEAALTRELKEELDIVPLASRPLIRTRHRYPEKSVLLDVWKIQAYAGSPDGVEGQRVEWRAISELDRDAFPPADIPIINALSLPDRYLITGAFSSEADFEHKLTTALQAGIRLVQLRLTRDWLSSHSAELAGDIPGLCAQLCRQYHARLLLNLAAEVESVSADGIHMNSQRLLLADSRPDKALVSASCHNRHELEHAQAIGVDFVVLSPVQATASHPGARTLGWEAFSRLVDGIDIPVYALGGISEDDMDQAWHAGAQGVAAISAFWQ